MGDFEKLGKQLVDAGNLNKLKKIRNAREPEPVAFQITPEEGSSTGESRAIFSVPSGMACKLAERPVSTKSAMFDLKVGDLADGATGEDTLYTVFYSPKPERTAEAIARC